MKKYFAAVLFLLLQLSVYASDANWKIHPTFDETVTHVVETPDYIYFTSQDITALSPMKSLQLFRYDKKGEEIVALSQSNLLNGNKIKDVIYNPSKGYLAVLYNDYNIDLLHNDGKVTNIPYYARASVSYPKDVNTLSIDPASDRLYLATAFGYVAINDKKNEIAESRLYGTPFNSFARLGNHYLAVVNDELYAVDASSPRLNFDQFRQIDKLPYISFLYPLSENVCLLFVGDSPHKALKKIVEQNGQLIIEDLIPEYLYYNNFEYTPNGFLAVSSDRILRFNNSGEYETLYRPQGYDNCAATTSNLHDVWNARMRKGLSTVKINDDSFAVTRDWMAPNAPATFASTSFINHPQAGFMMLDYGNTRQTSHFFQESPLQLSAVKNGIWKNYAPAYTNPERTSILTGSNGMAVDPDNKSYIYITSLHNGILRMNLNDPQDLVHWSYSGDPDFGNPGFIDFDLRPSRLPDWANISVPFFDNLGNLWMVWTNLDNSSDGYAHYYCLTPEDRKASYSGNVINPKAVKFQGGFQSSNIGFSIPLFKTGKGLLVYANSVWEDNLALIDTNATPLDPNDDTVLVFPSFTDTDGNHVDVQNTRFMWEDPSTGYVWVGHNNGVFYFSPSQARNGNFVINRVKVSRNDGTNLADYLLDGVTVNCMAKDSQGRKWFGLANGGVICTSSDGREILQEFTTDNSPLPDNEVVGIGYNEEANSLMFSTRQGYVEYFLPMTSGEEKKDVKAYPNPVRPEYSGYVTITDIPEGSFVKITDVAGNLVKDLGIMSGFELLWDLSDKNFNRVRSGVYHIMVSPSSESTKYSALGKILVIS